MTNKRADPRVKTTIYINADLHRQILVEAAQRGTSISEIVEEVYAQARANTATPPAVPARATPSRR